MMKILKKISEIIYNEADESHREPRPSKERSVNYNFLYITTGSKTAQIATNIEIKIFDESSFQYHGKSLFNSHTIRLTDFDSLSDCDGKLLLDQFFYCFILIENDESYQQLFNIQSKFVHDDMIRLVIVPSTLEDIRTVEQKDSPLAKQVKALTEFSTLTVPFTNNTDVSEFVDGTGGMDLYQTVVENITYVMFGVPNTGFICIDFLDYQFLYSTSRIINVLPTITFFDNKEIEFQQDLKNEILNLNIEAETVNGMLGSIKADYNLTLDRFSSIAEGVDICFDEAELTDIFYQSILNDKDLPCDAMFNLVIARKV